MKTYRVCDMTHCVMKTYRVCDMTDCVIRPALVPLRSHARLSPFGNQCVVCRNHSSSCMCVARTRLVSHQSYASFHTNHTPRVSPSSTHPVCFLASAYLLCCLCVSALLLVRICFVATTLPASALALPLH